MSRALVLLVVVCALVCGGARGADAQRFPFEVSLSLDRGAYESGAPVSFTIRVRNASTAPETLTFTTAQRYDVVIRRQGEVSRWSAGRAFPLLVSSQRWEPGETLVYTDQWIPATSVIPADVNVPVPQPLRPALYTIAAELTSLGPHPASAAQLFIVGRPLPLAEGCTDLVSRFPIAVAASVAAGAVDPPDALQALWRFDETVNRHTGYAPGGNPPNDLATIPSGSSFTVCLTAPGRYLMPDT